MTLRDLRGRELALLAELGALKLREDQARMKLADVQGGIRALEVQESASKADLGAEEGDHVEDE